MKHRYRCKRHRKPIITDRKLWSTNDGRRWWVHPTKGWRSTSVNNPIFK